MQRLVTHGSADYRGGVVEVAVYTHSIINIITAVRNGD